MADFSRNPKDVFLSLKDSYLRGELIFAVDLFLSLVASVSAILCVRDILGYTFYTRDFPVLYLATSLIASGIFFLATKTHCVIIRHLGPRDVIPFAITVMGKGVAILLVMSLGDAYSRVLLIIVVIDLLISSVLLLGVRVAMILVYDYVNRRLLNRGRLQQVLVYGISDKSVSVIKRLQGSQMYHVCGFLERTEGFNRTYLVERLPVFSFSDERRLDSIVRENRIGSIVFSTDRDLQAEADGLLPYCAKRGIKTLIVPNMDEISEGQPLLHPRPVKVEDLLGRSEITISLSEIRAFFGGKVVMVTGAAGSIGSELVRQLANFGVKEIVLYDNAETPMHNLRLELNEKYPTLHFVPVIGDVRHSERLDYAFRNWHPQVVFHAAAYKHVPLMEENPCEAILVNVFGTKNVADKCLEYGEDRMVMVSTDKAVNPTNIMGCTKRLAEIYVQSLGQAVERGEIPGKTRYVTTRFGNVLGSNGSVIPRFREQIAKGGPVTVTHPDITRFFMSIPEACRLVLEASTHSDGNQIFVFDMGQPVKIDLMARRMITLAGFVPDKDIMIEYTGLRPGEKLYEELLSNEENTLPSFHKRIRIAQVREYPYKVAESVVNRLTVLARSVQIEDMVRLMKQTVPEFKSENSRFKQLDAEEKING